MCETVVILGPTASGKSALALELSKYYQIEIISLDSALIYKGMDIGTAKPSKEELSICPHHLIDICEPKQSYSAANFRKDCIELVRDIRSRGALPVICGGTMMYYKALVDGISELPETDEAVRQKVAAMAQEQGWPALHALLKDFDPATFERLEPNDKQRVSRALEVYFMTGKAMSSFFALPKEGCPFSRLEFVLLPQNNDRTKLRELIRQRFMLMLEQGLEQEVKSLLANYPELSLDFPALRSVGYRQMYSYLKGECSKEEMIEQCVIATARLAKHQMTWLRGGLKQNSDESAEQMQSNPRFYLEIEDANKLQATLKIMQTYQALRAYAL